MGGLKGYKIDIISLANKQHEFDFAIDNRLLSMYEHSLVEKGEGKCHLTMDKSETMLTLKFQIEAQVELICDRSLDKFDYPVSLEETLIMKFGEDNYSLSEDVIVIKDDTDSINVSEYIYEFISLAVPLKKLHPRYEAIEDELPEIVYTTTEGSDSKTDNSDPRWEALKKLKGDN